VSALVNETGAGVSVLGIVAKIEAEKRNTLEKQVQIIGVDEQNVSTMVRVPTA